MAKVIVYHADCIDGAAAAWVISKVLGGRGVVCLPYDHANPAASEDAVRAALSLPDAEIHFADVTPEKPFLDELAASGRRIHILDHHKTAADKLKNLDANLRVHFNPSAPSAALLAWQHFFPGEKAPDILHLIDRMDGAAAGLKTPEDFAAALHVDAQPLRTPQQALKTLNGLAKLSFNEMAQKGAPRAAEQKAKIDRLLENPARVRLQLLPGAAPVEVPIINANIRDYGRQISPRLAQLGKESGANAAFIWAQQPTGAVTLSIRTSGNMDAGKIAEYLCKTMGITGGGHADSAAVHFSSLAEFEKRLPPGSAKPSSPPRPKPL
jgi:hypothetical protein